MLLSKEFYELVEMFEREKFYGANRYDKEEKSLWPKGNVYQCGETNKMFRIYMRGYSFGKAA